MSWRTISTFKDLGPDVPVTIAHDLRFLSEALGGAVKFDVIYDEELNADVLVTRPRVRRAK